MTDGPQAPPAPGRHRPAGLLISRELRRASRRWQRILVRVLPLVVLLGVFVVGVSTFEGQPEPEKLQRLGRTIGVLAYMLGIVVLMFALVTNLTILPAMTAVFRKRKLI